MGCTPDQLGDGAVIKWTIPLEVQKRTDVDHVNIWRSNCENTGYVKIDQVPYSQTWYRDDKGGRGWFYLVTFQNATNTWESCWHITFFPPVPHEAKLIEQIKRATPKVIQEMMTDEDYLNGLHLAVQLFNTYPPETYFCLANFPRSHEAYLIGLGQLTSLVSRYLPLSIRDWRYNEPGGVVMDIDRGAKINQAMELIARVYSQALPLVKLDFAWDSPEGLGTMQLPLSMGGVVSRGLLNVLDIFTATGR